MRSDTTEVMPVLRSEAKSWRIQGKPVSRGDDLNHIQEMRWGKARDWRESGINSECIGQGNTAEWEQACLKQDGEKAEVKEDMIKAENEV